ncbi:MAG TPA: class I SAM-dependent methyltransferase [Gaiellaceae bacterium]|jgi:ubiquinone/menaquinone biosynthesis C-methylase UbiE|nr:class I SAM-dependent methyltransferase [Gaiellaceae bacterium]
MSGQRDRWARWLLEHRHGGDPEELARQLPNLEEFRRRVLENAEVREGDVVLDVGTGDGLIGFGALEVVGESGRLIFSDVSEDLLDECRRIAAELGKAGRCEFLRASADDLPLPDASVDVATTRSVLIYLMDKRPAFVELHRVLRPGGRLSIFEPINIFGNATFRERYWGLDVSPVEHLAAKVRAQWKQPHEHPLLNFDERDLLRFAEEAGFGEIRMDYRAEIKQEPHWAKSWDMLKNYSGNPLDPTLGQEIAAALDDEERAEFEAHLQAELARRPLVPMRMASVYLRAVKTEG